MRSISTLLIALLAVTAGCIGSGEPVDAAGTDPVAQDDAAAGDTTAPTPSTPANENSSSTTEAEPPVPTQESEGEPQPAFIERTVPVDWSGELASAFCHPSGADTCTTVAADSGDYARDLKLSGTATGSVTLAWETSHPQDEELSFTLRDASSGDANGTVLYEVVGPSPLTLAFDRVVIAEGHSLILSVRPMSPELPAPVVTTIESGTVFTVLGLVVERIANPAAS